MKNLKSIAFQSKVKRQETKVEGSFTGYVQLGSPEMKCSGHGICKITKTKKESFSQIDWNPCSTIAQIVQRDDGSYLIQVLRFSVSASLYKKHFNGNYFKVDNDFNMGRFFQSAKKQFIKSGSYVFWEDDNFVYIDFSKKLDPGA